MIATGPNLHGDSTPVVGDQPECEFGSLSTKPS